MYKVSTTGTVPEIILNDLGGRTLTHPIVELDLGLEYTNSELFCSSDLNRAITNDELILVEYECIFLLQDDLLSMSEELTTLSGVLQSQIDVLSDYVDNSTSITDLGTITTNTEINLSSGNRIFSFEIGASGISITFINCLPSGNRDLIECYVTNGYNYSTTTIAGVTCVNLFESVGEYTLVVRTKDGGSTFDVKSTIYGS
jgi:hypothetical protein